jgi:phospholipase/carboxylesterase
MREDRFGSLTVHVAGGPDREGGGDGPVVVLMHGFGASGDDLAPLWRVLDVPPSVRFVFPAAPLDLARELGFPGARAWWRINLERLVGSPAAREHAALEVPAGLVEARAQVVELLDEIARRMAPSSLVLGGFSQGAMLACDVALHDPRPLAGLVLLSGTLIAASEWEPLAPARRGLPVFQSHGANDPLLPPSGAERLRDLLGAAGLPVEWEPFRGGHEIPARVLDGLGAFLAKVTA